MTIYKRCWQVTNYEGVWFRDDNTCVKFPGGSSTHTGLMRKKRMFILLDKLEEMGVKEAIVLRYTYFLKWRWIHTFEVTLC